MTGTFIAAIRSTPCVISTCQNVISAGDWTYLFRSFAQQTVCVQCARERWGYQPPSELPPLNQPPHVTTNEFVRVGRIQPKELDRLNAGDPKLKAAGD